MSKKKVQVRIAVAVDAQGRWSASGHHAHSDEDSFNWCAGKNVEHTRYILTAELDVPEVQEVAASAEKGGVTWKTIAAATTTK